MKIVKFESKYRDDLIFMILEAKNALGRLPGLNEDLLDVKANYFDKGDMFWVAVDDNDRVIGSIGYNSIENTDEVVLHRLFVKANIKHQGIGTALLKTAEEHLQSIGKKSAIVHLGDKKYFYESWRFYPKHGYKEYSPGYMRKKLVSTEAVEMIFDKSIFFSYLNKNEFENISHDIFNILADNMRIIAPTGNSRDDDYKCWYKAVSNGLQRDERQIILIKDKQKIIGFFQYYTNTDTFVMEEIQIKSEYQSKNIFRDLYGYIISNLKYDIEFVEAYANTANQKSVGILEHLGLSKIGMNKNGNSFHFKGKYSDLIKWYKLI